MSSDDLIKRIQDALGTAEEGDALVEVARNACRAEQELAAIKKRASEQSTITFGEVEPRRKFRFTIGAALMEKTGVYTYRKIQTNQVASFYTLDAIVHLEPEENETK
jgi:hypothetical protein